MDRQDDYIGLLEVVVFLAENWLILVLAPVLVAIGTYVWLGTMPPSYTATATIEIPATDLPIDTSEFLQGINGAGSGTTARLSGNDSAIISAKSDDAPLASSRVLAAYRMAADALAQEFQKHLEKENVVLDQIAPLIRRLEQDADNPESAIAIAQLLVTLTPSQWRADSAQAAIEALQSAPNIKTSVNGYGRVLPAILAGAAASGLLLFILLFRQAFRAAAETDEGRAKLQRIRRALLFRS